MKDKELKKPASDDFESEWKRYVDSKGGGAITINVKDVARHFAEWQKKKDVEEMMKTLIGGEIVKDIHNQLSVKSEPLNDTFGDIKFGDKVKVKIINKED